VSELTPRQQEKLNQKRQAQVGLASNVLGIAAGSAALADAARNPALRRPSRNPGPVGGRLARLARSPRVRTGIVAGTAAGALGLQAANLGGDLVTNAVLRRESSKKVKVQKMHQPNLVRTGRRVTESPVVDHDELAKAFRKPQDTRDSVYVPGHGEYHGVTRARRNPRALRIASAAGGAVLGGGAAWGLSGGRPIAGLGGAALGGVYGYRGSRWGQEFDLDPSEIRRLQADQRRIERERGRSKKVSKARYFDPEADRQRRIGLASGALAGGALVAGGVARGKLKLVRNAGMYGIKGTKRGWAATGTAAGLGAGSIASYKHGIDRRNQPWN
jgi:hypothetical protein